MQMLATGLSTNTLLLPPQQTSLVPSQDCPMPKPLPVSGFSLLELLVVVFIIGVLATMFTLSVGLLGDDSELDKETNRLQALLELAREDALTQGHELGLRFYPDGYEFAIYQEDFVEYYDPDDEVQDQSEWIVLGLDTLLKPRKLPAGIVLELEIEGREIVIEAKEETQFDRESNGPNPDGTDDVEPYRPQVWLYSTGDISPFVIRFRREFANDGLILEFSDDGSVELSEG